MKQIGRTLKPKSQSPWVYQWNRVYLVNDCSHFNLDYRVFFSDVFWIK